MRLTAPAFWYRQTIPPLSLRLLARVYGVLSARRARRLRSLARRLPVPVVMVGNVTVGGTGKTPCVAWLIEELRALGRRPGVLSRGYRGHGPFPHLVAAGDDPKQVGDEPLWLAQRCGVPVAVAPDRLAAAALLRRRHPQVDVLVCDDGLQHYRLARDLELCVIDGRLGFGNGFLLPAGPLREPRTRAATCALLLINGADPAPYGEHAVRFDLTVAIARRLCDGSERRLAEFAGGEVHALAGIGAPQRFFDALRGAGLALIEHPLPDHAGLDAATLAFGDRRPVLMTDKDAIKCRGLADPRLWAVPARVAASPQAASAVRQLLRTLPHPAG
ncbi:MAG: tetraacyldisaccharide 4'-kinase [Gammaproteobacteria bacterium]|nr:tetraacyldisaccharide 4'-kinase [Gammaproteobacteria bacterium]